MAYAILSDVMFRYHIQNQYKTQVIKDKKNQGRHSS